ncbi:SDR family oxidoreductase [Kaistia geumhonensis]|uniref:Ribitol 2-dehydrogenase n=1 Tax=Kaistia geumhonensis TaxID=410839 RepID=A0ABU0M6G1_9HYPH|nr:SDR family oxidoreductase [Kaistia geumhonensis]MCX5478230.1 SDR family oxidoreductase [Kaistia geumhonensis]MDQ0516554.1 ribitol 2-dehydrogenase [Kaistia geumhonensis]
MTGIARSQSIAGKVMVVTGASSGIGRAVARRFADEGAKLVLAARSADRLAAVAAEIGGDALAVPADITRAEDIARLYAAARERFGGIDILFANAGSYVSGDVVDGDPDEFDKIIAINVNSVVRMVHAVLPEMIARRSGDVIVTSSISGHQAIHWEPVYSATKHAVQSFVHGVRRQVSRHNVRVGALAPGMVLNELWGIDDPAEIERRAAAHEGLVSEDVAEALLFMLTRPPHVTIRDLVMLPQNQDL